MARNQVPPEDRHRIATWVIGHDGRKVGAGTIAAVLAGPNAVVDALRTLRDIAKGVIPLEADVLESLYPGMLPLFKKAHRLWLAQTA
jgi:hypothetical protein